MRSKVHVETKPETFPNPLQMRRDLDETMATLDRVAGREHTNRNLIKGLSQRLDKLERGDTPPPSPVPLRPEDV